MGRRKRKKEDVPAENAGMIMSVSLFLIILTFIIMLNSISVIDERKTRIALGSLAEAFTSIPGGLSPVGTGESVMPPSAPMIGEVPEMSDLLLVIDKKTEGQIQIVTKNEKEIIIIHESTLFQKDSLELEPSLYPLLNKLCDIINRGDYPIEIVGHTDDTPADEKGFGSDWELTSHMAMEVSRYLIGKGKVLPLRVTACGRGSLSPITTNETRVSRERNRRVEIILSANAAAYVKRIYDERGEGVFTYKKFDFKGL